MCRVKDLSYDDRLRCHEIPHRLHHQHRPQLRVATGMGKMRLVHAPVSGASMSSNVSIPNPSCNQNCRRDLDVNPVSYTVTIPNPN